jgi:excisionase family DNA binding protein
VTLHERLSQAAELGLTVTLSPAELRELLEPGAVEVAKRADERPDLTVNEVAARLARPCSTVRAWVAEGRFAGSYKLSERDWRVPAASVVAFVEARQPAVPSPSGGRPVRRRKHRAAGGDADLSAWRRPV